MSRPGFSDRIYRSAKLAAVVDLLVEDGVPMVEALCDIGVAPGELHSPDPLISLEQLLAACTNALRLSRELGLPFPHEGACRRICGLSKLSMLRV